MDPRWGKSSNYYTHHLQDYVYLIKASSRTWSMAVTYPLLSILAQLNRLSTFYSDLVIPRMLNKVQSTAFCKYSVSSSLLSCVHSPLSELSISHPVISLSIYSPSSKLLCRQIRTNHLEFFLRKTSKHSISTTPLALLLLFLSGWTLPGPMLHLEVKI